jgi:hypothetical protein
MQPGTAQIGSWYKDLQTGVKFEVVAVDEAAETIEVQMLDGEICEYDADTWSEMRLRPTGEPEDWRRAFELSGEDGLDPDRPFHPESWDSPLDHIESDIVNGLDEDYS